MATEFIRQESVAHVEDFTRPYAPSWLDHLLAGIERLPGPTWLFYIVLWIVQIIAVTVLLWLAGALPVGTFDAYLTSAPFYGVALLALIHYLQHVARTALAAFWPALGERAGEYPRLQYVLTVLPARPMLVAAGVGIILAAVAGLSDTAGGRAQLVASPVERGLIIVINYWGVAFMPIMIYSMVHRLRTVTYCHRIATDINLFAPAPLHAFSGLTARASIALLIIMYYAAVTNPAIFTDPVWIGLLALLGVLTAGLFLVPLIGMHRRLVAERERLEAEVNQHLQAIITDLHQGIRQRVLGDVDAWHKAMASLVLERQVVEQIPTWPWPAETFRAVITTFLLPIGLFVIQFVIQTLLTA